VRADVVDGAVPAIDAKEGDELVSDFDRFALAVCQLSDSTYRLELGHFSIVSKPSGPQLPLLR
jgi:hypothetical protein